LDAAHAFYGVARSQVAVATSTELVQWLDSIVVYNRMRVEEGAAAEVDLIRATLERDRAAAEMSMRAADLARDRMTLAAFLGDPVSEPAARAVAPSPALIPLPDLFAGALRSNAPIAAVQEAAMVMSREEMTAALGRRPDVLAARERVAAGSAAVSVERSMILRELSATFGTKRSEGTTTLIAGVSLPVPLFGQNRGEIARASAERDALGAELVATERDARSEIAGALAAAQVLTARIRTLYNTGDSASSYLGRADEARRIVHGAYREGGAPLVQVIDAARAWGEARSAYYELLYAQHESVLALRTVMGLRPVDAETQAGTGGGARGASVDR
jgi:cobalt-zinc-cadmium efflux system outer membrane protein